MVFGLKHMDGKAIFIVVNNNGMKHRIDDNKTENEPKKLTHRTKYCSTSTKKAKQKYTYRLESK